MDDNSRLIIANKKFGVLNQQGRIIIPAIYDSLYPIYNNRYIVWKENKIGVIDTSNKEVIPVKYIADTTQRYLSFGYDIGHLREGLIPTSFNGKYGYIFDKSFKEAIPFIYDYANEFYNGLAEVKINNKIGIINKTGKEVIPVKYDSIDKYSENFYSVRTGTKYGFVDLKGHEFFNDN